MNPPLCHHVLVYIPNSAEGDLMNIHSRTPPRRHALKANSPNAFRAPSVLRMDPVRGLTLIKEIIGKQICEQA
jgi:hypothetical protein